MKKTTITLILLAFLSSCGIFSKKGSSPISFNYTYTSDHCGGEAPTEDILKELMTPHPLNDTLYMFDNSNQDGDPVILAFKNGKCVVPRPANGTYFVFASMKLDEDAMMRTPQAVDPSCAIEFSRRMYTTIDVNDEVSSYTSNIHKTCNPCMPQP